MQQASVSQSPKLAVTGQSPGLKHSPAVFFAPQSPVPLVHISSPTAHLQGTYAGNNQQAAQSGTYPTSAYTSGSPSWGTNNSLAPIVKEGWIWKRGEHIKNWRRRYFALRQDGTFYGYRTVPNAGQEPLNNFTVRDCQLMKLSKPKPFTFVLRGLQWTNVVERIFYVESSDEREGWLEAIASVANSLNLSRPESVLSPFTSNMSNSFPIALAPQSPSAAHSASSAASSSSSGVSSSTNNYHPCEVMDISNDDALQDELLRDYSDLGRRRSGRLVALDDFELLKVLGKGTFGKVILCRDKLSNDFYAIKILKKSIIIKVRLFLAFVTLAFTQSYVKSPVSHIFT